MDFNGHFLLTSICHSEGALAATEESLLARSEILRSTQDDILRGFQVVYAQPAGFATPLQIMNGTVILTAPGKTMKN